MDVISETKQLEREGRKTVSTAVAEARHSPDYTQYSMTRDFAIRMCKRSVTQYYYRRLQGLGHTWNLSLVAFNTYLNTP